MNIIKLAALLLATAVVGAAATVGFSLPQWLENAWKNIVK